LTQAQARIIKNKITLDGNVVTLTKIFNNIKEKLNINVKSLNEFANNPTENQDKKAHEDLFMQIRKLTTEKEVLAKENKKLIEKNSTLEKENQSLKQENQALKKPISTETLKAPKVTPIIAKPDQAVTASASAKPPALPPTPPKSPTAARSITPSPVPSAAPNVAKPVAAAAKPLTPPPSKPAGAAVDGLAAAKTNTPLPPPLTLAQQIAKNKEEKAKTEAASKAAQVGGSKPKPAGK
jgi:hypothetical protein